MKIKFKQYLKENPDRYILSTGEMAGWQKGMTFGYFGGDMIISSKGITHGILIRNIPDEQWTEKNIKLFLETAHKNVKDIVDYSPTLGFKSLKNLQFTGAKKIAENREMYETTMTFVARTGFGYAGRIWKNPGIVSFWHYPKSKEDWLKFKKDIAKKGINIKDNWNLDLSKDDGKGHSLNIGTYEKSKEMKSVKHNLQAIHLMNPIAKKAFLDKVKGFGSKKQMDIAKKAGFDSYAEYKAFTQQENEEKTFKNYLTEIFDKPAKWNWIKKEQYQWKAKFEITKEENTVRFYTDLYRISEGGVTTWIVEFNRIQTKGHKGTQKLINDDKMQFTAFSTVKDILFEFLKKKKPTSFALGAKEQSRRRLYKTFAKLIENKTKYRFTRAVEEISNSGENVQYMYFRIKGK